MVDAAISSHCCILNSTERLELIRKSNKVAAIMGEIETDRLRIREENKRKKEAETAERAARKAAKENKRKEKEKQEREICERTMAAIKDKGINHVTRLTVPVLKYLLQYVFLSDEYKRTDLRKPELIEIVRIKYDEFESQKGEEGKSEEV